LIIGPFIIFKPMVGITTDI